MFDWIFEPWPWYVTGPLIGLVVPMLLLIDNKQFGMSAGFRHILAATVPGKIEFLNYDWRPERWNLVMSLGTLIGSALFTVFVMEPETTSLSAATWSELASFGITPQNGLLPVEYLAKESLFSFHPMIYAITGGFLVGFGSRYAGGCTSGHAISGMSDLQPGSLLAVIGFFIGGLLMVHVLYPIIL